MTARRLSILGRLIVCSALAAAACRDIQAPRAATTAMAESGAPGVYRVMVGAFEVIALSDGAVPLPLDTLLTGISREELHAALARHFLTLPVETSVNAYLVNTGSKIVLIDTGAATLYGPTLGNLPTSLAAAGYAPGQIDEVYITHMHADHMGGLMQGTATAFPNAVIRADQHDADYWLSDASQEHASDADARRIRNAKASFGSYIEAGRFRPFEGDTELVPGVRARTSHGHTPGHTSYVVESQGKKMVFWGDLMHAAAVQFERPAVTIQFDRDAPAAADQRVAAYVAAADQGYLVGAAHVSFPGIGRVRREGAGYAWVPINYSPRK